MSDHLVKQAKPLYVVVSMLSVIIAVLVIAIKKTVAIVIAMVSAFYFGLP